MTQRCGSDVTNRQQIDSQFAPNLFTCCYCENWESWKLCKITHSSPAIRDQLSNFIYFLLQRQHKQQQQHVLNHVWHFFTTIIFSQLHYWQQQKESEKLAFSRYGMWVRNDGRLVSSIWSPKWVPFPGSFLSQIPVAVGLGAEAVLALTLQFPLHHCTSTKSHTLEIASVSPETCNFSGGQHKQTRMQPTRI